MSNNYEEGRYERLKESIDEYLGSQGSDTGSTPFLRDLNKACFELNLYHQECVDNFAVVQDHFSLAEKPVPTVDPWTRYAPDSLWQNC
jgi:hypothetical protein